MRGVRRVTAAAGLVGCVLLAGCSSGNATHTAATPSAPPATNQRPGGLIGAVDASRVAAVCANAQSAQTVLAVDTKGATEALSAAAVLLERPPVDPKAAADALAIRRDLRQGHTDLAVTLALTYCHAR